MAFIDVKKSDIGNIYFLIKFPSIYFSVKGQEPLGWVMKVSPDSP